MFRHRWPFLFSAAHASEDGAGDSLGVARETKCTLSTESLEAFDDRSELMRVVDGRGNGLHQRAESKTNGEIERWEWGNLYE
jgi:hypothetical protein